MEKVKFGVSLHQVCLHYNDLPAPLLILLLKLNKEAPAKKDVFRAPGHQANMKKLIHVLQSGRLVNIDNFNIYTIASVLKKFLSKLPGGLFGQDIEARFFHAIHYWQDDDKRIREFNRSVDTYLLLLTSCLSACEGVCWCSIFFSLEHLCHTHNRVSATRAIRHVNPVKMPRVASSTACRPI